MFASLFPPKPGHSRRRRPLQNSPAALIGEQLERRLVLSGVTVITHGFGGNIGGWVNAMANEIRSHTGPESPVFSATVGLDAADELTVDSAQIAGQTPSETDSWKSSSCWTGLNSPERFCL